MDCTPLIPDMKADHSISEYIKQHESPNKMALRSFYLNTHEYEDIIAKSGSRVVKSN